MIEETKKGQLLNMRGDLQELIEKLNKEFIRGTPNYDTVHRDVAYKVRDCLIQADNEINAYRLKTR